MTGILDKFHVEHGGHGTKVLARPNQLTPDCLTQVYGVTVVVTSHPVYGTPLIAPVFASHQKRSNEGDKPSADTTLESTLGT